MSRRAWGLCEERIMWALPITIPAHRARCRTLQKTKTATLSPSGKLLTKLKTQPFVCRALYGFNLACPPKVSNSAPLAGGKNYSDQESPLAFLKITLQGDSRTLAPSSLISSHLGSKQLYSIKSCPGMDPEAMGQPVMDQNL